MAPYDPQKLQDLTLALLGALCSPEGQVWKRHDFGVMDALHERGLITNPRSRNESVWLTEDGMAQAKMLAAHYLAREPPP